MQTQTLSSTQKKKEKNFALVLTTTIGSHWKYQFDNETSQINPWSLGDLVTGQTSQHYNTDNYELFH